MKPFTANGQTAFYSGWINRCLLPLLLFLCVGAFTAKAQTVTIPDTAFAYFLRVKFPLCMNGNLLDTTCSGIVNATIVSCPGKGITNLDGIQYFDNLKDLNCSQNNLVSIPSLPSGLLRLDLYGSLLFWPQLPASFPVLPTGLTYLDIGNNQMDSLPALPAGLDTLICSNNPLTFLPALPPGLKLLDCRAGFGPPILNLPPLPSTLEALYCGVTLGFGNPTNTPFTYTSFPQLPAGLIVFESAYGTMPQDFDSLPAGLKHFRCLGCGLTSLPELPHSLRILDVHDNQLTSLPPSFDYFRQNLIRMDFIAFSNNPITCIPLMPPGPMQSFYWSGTQLTCQPYDPWELNGLNQMMAELPVCNVFNNTNSCPGDPQWNIVGKVYLDDDSNCTLNLTDTALKNIPMQLWNGANLVQQTVTDVNGHFVFDTDHNTYQVRVKTAGLPFNVLCPANNQLSTIIDFIDSVETGMEFGLRCKSGFDLEARSIVTGVFAPFRPGSWTDVHMVVGEIAQFYGAQCAAGRSGSVVINITGPVTFLGPAPGALTPTVMPGMLIYTIADFATVDPIGDFNFFLRTDTSAQAVGQQVCFTVSVMPTTGDRNPSNNTLTHCSVVEPNPVVVGTSYDPNDKQVYPIGNIDTAQHWLTYTIRFQNTGTAAATYIHVDDTLDSNLDETTFQLLAYSHESVVQVRLNTLRFNFPNINLPDSTDDEPGSHGYVQFKVKLKDNLPPGTEISNNAAIYFDANPPVITNTVQTTIGLKFSGAIVTESGSPVPTVTVDLSGDASASVLADTGGLYEFTSSKLGSFIITPAKNNDNLKANGVSTLDILLIRKHILGSPHLSSPYKIIAADVNGSNSVTVADITNLRSLILGRDTTFNGKLWTFVPGDYVFPDTLNPFPYNSFRNYNDLNANQTNQNFIAVKLGDVSGNWDPGTPKMGSTGEVQFAMGEYQTLPDEEITIPVQVSDFNEIGGYQFTMTWNAEVIELLEVNNQSIQGYYGRFGSEGFLTTSWNDGAGGSVPLENDAIAFELKFRVIGASGTSTEIKIGSEITKSEAYTSQLDLLDIKSKQGKVTVGDVNTGVPNNTSLYSLHVQPNPFTTSATITCTVPRDETVTITISDVLGKKVKLIRSEFSKGEHKLTWSGDDEQGNSLPKGIYYIGLNSESTYLVTKVVMIK